MTHKIKPLGTYYVGKNGSYYVVRRYASFDDDGAVMYATKEEADAMCAC